MIIVRPNAVTDGWYIHWVIDEDVKIDEVIAAWRKAKIISSRTKYSLTQKPFVHGGKIVFYKEFNDVGKGMDFAKKLRHYIWENGGSVLPIPEEKQ